MQRELSLKTAFYQKRHKRQKNWKKVFMILASVVVFCTTYALILPAITMEPDYICGYDAHIHNEDCYRIPEATPVTSLVCESSSLEIHEHTTECIDENGEPRCGIADFVLHSHINSCFDAGGELVCSLPEIKAHIHADACWQQPHVHEEACYTQVQGELLCTIEEGSIHAHNDTCYTSRQIQLCELTEEQPHTHGDGCYTQVSEQICQLDETEGHTHSDSCYDESNNLSCTLPEITGHTHTNACYQVTDAFTCELEETEGHLHSESCFDTVQDLTCTLETDIAHIHSDACFSWTQQLNCAQLTAEDGAEPYMICEEQELYPHTHTSDCFTSDNTLICNLLEVSEHIHNDTCFVITLAETDEPVLMCGMEVHEHTEGCLAQQESAEDLITGDMLHAEGFYCGIAEHTHQQESCFDKNGGLICTMSEHEHSSECRVSTEKLYAFTCGKSAHAHNEYCYDSTGVFICDLAEHFHESRCTLTAKDWAQVDLVISLIEDLPDSIEAEDILDSFDQQTQYADYEASYCTLRKQCTDAYDAYEALTVIQKDQITNLDHLLSLEWLWGGASRPAYPALETDGAMLTSLQTVDSTVLTEMDSGTSIANTVRPGDTILFSFAAEAEVYGDTVFSSGRMELMLLLPLNEEEATFDLKRMSWLDDVQITTEDVYLDGTWVTCQVLTGSWLWSGDDREYVIPGIAEQTVAVKVGAIQPGKQVTVLIQAAMEHNAWDGVCPQHEEEERLNVRTKTYTAVSSLTEEEMQAIYDAFCLKLEELEQQAAGTSDCTAMVDALLIELQEAYQLGTLSDEHYAELCSRAEQYRLEDLNRVAEQAIGNNWMILRDSGWFEEYSSYAENTSVLKSPVRRSAASKTAMQDATIALMSLPTDRQPRQPSDVQVDGSGGSNTSNDGAVTVSKTISGTELENVFDITLQVQTSINLEEIRKEPDMAVVIVMDISNTMKSDFGDTNRYEAAMVAAEDFLDKFAANNTLGISKIGYVAFNTDAHQIFDLTSCTTQEQANALKNTMKIETGAIINAAGYADSHNRFTNVEAGLAMGADMLSKVSNENKFIIFLSDGFPTTYLNNNVDGYLGYDPYTDSGVPGTDGVFYDYVAGVHCDYGTSYSDKAAIRARTKATGIKESGIDIFSIGVDVAGQTISKYLPSAGQDFSVVDRTNTTYEIGDASSTEAYKNWLKYSIGSGYYYDSTDADGLMNAYNQIFEEIWQTVESGTKADWVTQDPIPSNGGLPDSVDFIGLYTKDSVLVGKELVGAYAVDGENTAVFDDDDYAISWDLKQSGYQTKTVGNATTYLYQLVYRVRLKNENTNFVEETIYPTNDTTTLRYRMIESVNGNDTVSDPKTIDFPIPAVHGYLVELEFQKVGSTGERIPGAEFTLSHDTETCSICRGDKTAVSIQTQTAVSAADGMVSFSGIPSGHIYTLEETQVPSGYVLTGNQYTVTAAYDVVTVTVRSPDGKELEWDGTVLNHTYYELPETGGGGVAKYRICGGLLMAAPWLWVLRRQRFRGRRATGG